MGQCYGKKTSAAGDGDGDGGLSPLPSANGGGGRRSKARTPARSTAPASPTRWPSPFPYGTSASPLPGGVSPSPVRSTPGRGLRRFAPPSPAKHIKAALRRRKGPSQPKQGPIPEAEGGEEEAEQPLDKTFGYGKNFGAKYEVGKEVGRGHFGHTCSARVKRGDLKGQVVAVKIIAKAKMTTAISIEDVRREVKILKALSGHPNLVKFHDACEDTLNVYIIMELCEGGELLDRILSRGGRYTEEDAKPIVVQILSVVAFCHLQGVVHRDLKPENFLFTSRDESAPMKLIDFGLSDFIRTDERLNDIVGSAYYVAPEVLHRSYSIEADIWSIGVITYILLCGSRPFWARTESGIFRAVLRADPNFDDSPWPSVSPEAKDFVRRFLNKDYRKRMTAAQALTHPWLHDGQRQIPLDILIYKLVKVYLRATPFKRAALKALSKALTEDELVYIKAQFNLLEPNKDRRVVSFENFRMAIMRNATDAMKDSRILDILNALEPLSYRKMDFEEFCAATISPYQMEALEGWEQIASTAFEAFEREGNRVISVEELTQEMNLPQTAQSIVRDWIRPDGKLSFLGYTKFLHDTTCMSMAWRLIRRKKGLCTGFLNLLVSSNQEGSICAISGSFRSIYCTGVNLTVVPRSLTKGSILRDYQTVRHFHATPELLSSRPKEKAPGLKAPKREKLVKRSNRTQPPVDLPYVPKQKINVKRSHVKTIDIFEGMTIHELAKRTGASVHALLEIHTSVGDKVDSEFDPISVDVAELIAMEVGVSVRRLHSDEGSILEPRPAVVTVMGHVDHGKTSLLDALRQTSVAAKEAGGITQHLGAFVVEMPSGASITFLDTPGHAAFSAMRARGAAVTDIVVLVVAADDGVMPQTLEAMSHAKKANVPIVVAINKCDKPAADPERVRIQLGSEGLHLEDLGGDVQVVEVSAISKAGLDKLEEALLLQAEMMDLKARIDGPAQAYVVEARLDRGRGPLATAIVKFGTLICGQHIVVGAEWGKIRSIRDMVGRAVESARPAMPVEIEGLRGLPMAGDDVVVVDTEERARMLSSGRRKKLEKDRLHKVSEERSDIPDTSEEAPERVELPIIVKADVRGTVQAVRDALRSMNSPQVFVNIVHVGVGPVSQSDVDLAEACGACIVGFNIRNPSSEIGLAAKKASVKIYSHQVIYHLLEEMGNLIVDRAPGTPETQIAGEAEILNIFELKGRSKSKGPDVKIAGCRIVGGRFTKSSTMRLLRSGEVMFEGSCASLKREKQDVEAIGKGSDCGLIIQDCDDYRVGDIVQCLEQVKRKPKFVSSESGAVHIEC